MRFLSTAALLLASSLVFAGCAAQQGESDVADDSELQAEDTTSALSTWAKTIIGSYQYDTGATPDFSHLVLRSDGTFLAETEIRCITTPCVNPRSEGRWIGYAPASGSHLGRLRLTPKGEKSSQYWVSVAGDGSGFKLAKTKSGAAAGYKKTTDMYCSVDADCDTFTNTMLKCVGYKTCNTESNSCTYKCGTRPTACDVKHADVTRRYVGESKEMCMRIRYTCDFANGETSFSDECGCGCIKAACKVGGCSGEICADTEMMSTCVYRPEAACYKKFSKCERDAAGACGWRGSKELTSCLGK